MVAGLAEIGDKTQILSMMLANIPAVLIGQRFAGRLPVRVIRIAAALVFAALAVLTVTGVRG